MADYKTIEAGNTDPRGFTLVAKASGSPLTTGTVNYYLKALTGTNAGKWWRDSDQTWQAAETANGMTHQADGHWSRTLAASPWIDGVEYLEYGKESEDLHVPVSRWLKGGYSPSANSDRRVDLGLWLGSAPLALDNQRVPTHVGSLAADVLTAAAIANDAVAQLQNGLATLAGQATIAGYLDTEIGAILTAVAALPTAAGIADQVWDETASQHNTAGSMGAKLNTAATSSSLTPADVWGYANRSLTQSAAQVLASVSGTRIAVTRGDSLSIALTGLGALTGNSKVWFTVKRRDTDADAAAMLQIERTVGLVYLAASGSVTAGHGVITVDDAAAGNITITLDEASSALLLPGSYVYDVQSLIEGNIRTHTAGEFGIGGDITRATN